MNMHFEPPKKRGPKPGSASAIANGKRLQAALADPAVRAKMSAASKAALADPAVRAKKSAASKAAWADPAVRAKMSAASKAALADPAVRAKMSAASKAAWADPAVRAKMSAALDWLNPGQVAEIVERIRSTKDAYADIAEDWLVTGGTIARIAKDNNVQRRLGRKAS